MKRLLKTPKRYLIDAGLAAAAISVDEPAAMRDAHLLGRLLDTFVTAQFRAKLEVSTSRPRLHHLRTEGGRREIDLLLELSGQRVIGIEIKAAAAVDHKDARHLEWLRDELGERFVHRLVLHAGRCGVERASAEDRLSFWLVPDGADMWALDFQNHVGGEPCRTDHDPR